MHTQHSTAQPNIYSSLSRSRSRLLLCCRAEHTIKADQKQLRPKPGQTNKRGQAVWRSQGPGQKTVYFDPQLILASQYKCLIDEMNDSTWTYVQCRIPAMCARERQRISRRIALSRFVVQQRRLKCFCILETRAEPSLSSSSICCRCPSPQPQSNHTILFRVSRRCRKRCDVKRRNTQPHSDDGV